MAASIIGREEPPSCPRPQAAATTHKPRSKLNKGRFRLVGGKSMTNNEPIKPKRRTPDSATDIQAMKKL